MKKKSLSKNIVTLGLSIASVCLIATVGFSAWIIIYDPTQEVSNNFGDNAFDVGSITDGDNFKNVNIKYNDDGSATLYIPYSFTKNDFDSAFDKNNNNVRDYLISSIKATRKHGANVNKNLGTYIDVYDANKWRMKDQPHLYVSRTNNYIYSNKTTVNSTNNNEDFLCTTKFDYSKNYDLLINDYVDWSKIKTAYTLDTTADPSGDNSPGYTTGIEKNGLSPVRLRRRNSGTTFTYCLESYVSRYNKPVTKQLLYATSSVYNASSITSISNFTIHNSNNKNIMSYATLDVAYTSSSDSSSKNTTLTFNFPTFHAQSGLAYKLLDLDKPIDINLYKIYTDTTTNKTNWKGNITYFLDETRDVQQKTISFDVDSQFDTYKGYDLVINDKNLATIKLNLGSSTDTTKNYSYNVELNKTTYNYYTYIYDYLNKEDMSFDFNYVITFKKKDGVSQSLKDILSSYLFDFDFNLFTEDNPKW